MRPSEQYHKWVEWSEKDRAYVGRCPNVIAELRGSDPDQVYQQLCDAVDRVLAEMDRVKEP